ncbi:MAG: hypothetical protein HY534_00070 [Chloroflexi bacterium]|nr:hypothetical protein [Chloroflexota bacterium]
MRLRVDPWATEYGSGLQLGDEGATESPQVDVGVEVANPADWCPVSPGSVERPASIYFVDGTQRLEAHVTIEGGGETFFGVMVSLAVGAARAASGSVTIETPLVHRSLAMGDAPRLFTTFGGEALEAITVRAGSQDLEFVPRPSEKPGSEGIRDAIDSQRRALEKQFGEGLAARGEPLVVMDGPLPQYPASTTALVGYMKTIHRQYLPAELPECRAVVTQLRAGERSPVFMVLGRASRYSWYLRLTDPRPIDHSLAGVVRLETLAEVDRERAVELANLTARYLPDFASPRERDPRAPQNLLPIGGLEARLRHEMGDPAWVRRAIEQHLFLQAVA